MERRITLSETKSYRVAVENLVQMQAGSHLDNCTLVFKTKGSKHQKRFKMGGVTRVRCGCIVCLIKLDEYDNEAYTMRSRVLISCKPRKEQLLDLVHRELTRWKIEEL